MATRSSHATRTKAGKRPRTFRWTRSWLARLPDDGNRYEVLNGELLVTPQAGPDHQGVAFVLGARLLTYCETHGLGSVVGPGTVIWAGNELQPDVQVIPARISRGAKWTDLPLPLLVVEVLSPGSERHDRGKKRDAYLSLGIPEYWIVDLGETRVLVSRSGDEGAREPRVVTDTLAWQPRPDVEPLTIDVKALLDG